MNTNKIQNKFLIKSKERAKRTIERYKQQLFDINDKVRILLSVRKLRLRQLSKKVTPDDKASQKSRYQQF